MKKWRKQFILIILKTDRVKTSITKLLSYPKIRADITGNAAQPLFVGCVKGKRGVG